MSDALSVIPQSPLVLLRVGVWAKICTVLIEKDVTHVAVGIGQIDERSPIKRTVMMVTPCDENGDTGGEEAIAIEVGVIPEPAAEEEKPPAPPPPPKIYMPGADNDD